MTPIMRLARIGPVVDSEPLSVDHTRKHNCNLTPLGSVPHENVATAFTTEHAMLILPELERRSNSIHHRALHLLRPTALAGRVELEPVNLGIVEFDRIVVGRPPLDELPVVANDRGIVAHRSICLGCGWHSRSPRESNVDRSNPAANPARIRASRRDRPRIK